MRLPCTRPTQVPEYHRLRRKLQTIALQMRFLPHYYLDGAQGIPEWIWLAAVECLVYLEDEVCNRADIAGISRESNLIHRAFDARTGCLSALSPSAARRSCDR